MLTGASTSLLRTGKTFLIIQGMLKVLAADV
jgi:hypothetical protein